MAETVLTIGSEDDAWDTLKSAIKGNLELDHLDFEFTDWPVLNIKLKGEKFQASITPKVMEGFIALQKDIYRAFAKLRYNDANHRLTNEEKESLEIIVKVEQGSSDLFASLKGAIEVFAKEAANKMESKHIVTVVLGAALMWTSHAAWNSYLDQQVKIKSMDVQTYSSTQETERMKVLRDIVKDKPVLQVVQENSEETYDKILRTAVSADSIQIGSEVIKKEEVKQLIKSTRKAPVETRLDGACQIRKVDSSKLGVFVVEVTFLPDGRVFKAEVKEEFLATRDKFKGLIRDAEWEKKPVKLTMNCREKNGEVVDAVILDVEKI